MNQRILSIDTLRGLDMLLLCGGATALKLWLEYSTSSTAPGWLMHQFTHAEWGGEFTCWDLVMPLFIFITGASMPFAFAKYRENGGTLWRVSTTRRVVRRVSLLFLLGMLVQGNLECARTEHMSLFCNTLQAIAEGYLITAVVLMFCGLRGQVITAVVCMLSIGHCCVLCPTTDTPVAYFCRPTIWLYTQITCYRVIGKTAHHTAGFLHLYLLARLRCWGVCAAR